MESEYGQSSCYWVKTAQADARRFSPLPGDLTVDVAIIGGGIAGISTAAKLRAQGKTVAVLEALRVGEQVTGRSTAKVTSQHNLKYRGLLDDFGREEAKIYADANQSAIEDIAGYVEHYGIDCEFVRKDAYVYTRSEDYIEKVKSEADGALQAGLPASFVEETPLPFPVKGAVKFAGQAQFNPCKYMAGLAAAIDGERCRIFENTRVTDVDYGRTCHVKTAHGTVTAHAVVMATHMPLGQTGMFYTKAYPHIHPMIAARISAEDAPDGMFISAESPVHSVRTTTDAQGDSWLVTVGNGFKPGHIDKEKESFEDLASFIRDNFPRAEIAYSWTNIDYESMDGIPFIGNSPGHDNLYVATGFNAWGLTTGTYAGTIIADLIAGVENSWAEFFSAKRLDPVKSAKDFAKGNYEAGKHLVSGYLKGRPKTAADIKPGEGAVIKQHGDEIAVYKDDQGAVHAVSAACSHMGCILGWNGTDRTWDCHCHGSRFSHEGAVLHGPATKNLEKKALEAGRGEEDGTGRRQGSRAHG